MSVITTRSASANASRYAGDMTAMRLKRFGWNTATTRLPTVTAAAAAPSTALISRREVGVVVDQRDAVVDAADVEPTGDSAELGQGPRTPSSKSIADRAGHRQRAERVAHVVDAAQGQIDGAQRLDRRARR